MENQKIREFPVEKDSLLVVEVDEAGEDDSINDSVPLPFIHASVLLTLLELRFSSNALSPHPRTTTLPAAERPPAKPPPLQRICFLVRLSDPLVFAVQFLNFPTLRVSLTRPPPKPPWLLYVPLVFLVWTVEYGVSMGSWFQVFGICFSWLKYAHQVVDENPHRAIWTNFCIVLIGYASGAPSCFLLCFFGLIKCSVWSSLIGFGLTSWMLSIWTYHRWLLALASTSIMQEQAAKEATAAAAKKAFEANFENCSDDLQAARELAASATVAVAKSRKVWVR